MIAWSCQRRAVLRSSQRSVPSAPKIPFRNQLRILIRSEGLMLIGLIGLMAAFGRTGGIFNVIPLMAENELGLNPTQIGFGLGMISIVSLVIVMPSGIRDKLDENP